MRKLLWCAAALMMLTAGGFFWLASRPGSSLAPCLAKCCPWRSANACHSCCGDLDDAPPSLDELPSEPIAVEDLPPLTVALASEPTTPAICIHENEPLTPPQADEQIDLAIYKGRPMPPADVPACPLTMPYCKDDAKPKMPYAGDTEESETVESVVPKAEDTELLKGQTVKPPSQSETNPPRCEIEPHHHQHYPGCPAHGHCTYSGSYGPHRDNLNPFPERKPLPMKPTGDAEESEEPEEPVRLKKKVKMHETRKPIESSPITKNGLDTMEYRRSDGKLDEYGPGPF